MQLQTEISHLQVYEQQQAAKKEYAAYITALKDSNSIYLLEEQSPGLFDLRELRNNLFLHNIINHRDSPELVTYMLMTKLQTDMSVACRSRFQRRFGETFVSDVVQLYLQIWATETFP